MKAPYEKNGLFSSYEKKKGRWPISTKGRGGKRDPRKERTSPSPGENPRRLEQARGKRKPGMSLPSRRREKHRVPRTENGTDLRAKKGRCPNRPKKPTKGKVVATPREGWWFHHEEKNKMQLLSGKTLDLRRKKAQRKLGKSVGEKPTIALPKALAGHREKGALGMLGAARQEGKKVWGSLKRTVLL